MTVGVHYRVLLGLLVCALAARGGLAHAQGAPLIWPEQRTLPIRDPAALPKYAFPLTPPPATLDKPDFQAPERLLTLDEALRTALNNSRVVRVLAGVTAVSSGNTIYDPAIANTENDVRRGVFDPNVALLNTWDRRENPLFDPFGPRITGGRGDIYALDFGLSKTTRTGGQVDFGVNAGRDRLGPGLLENRDSLDLAYTQPLLQGGGVAVNLAPVVLARIDTERSFFQYKSSVQQLVRGVIDAYLNLIAARVIVWTRERQVEQAQFAFELTEAKFEIGLANAGELAQTRVSLANFRSNLVTAQGNVLDQEAVIRNLLGFPPYDENRLVPVTPMNTQRFAADWNQVVALAGERRPDLIELKLILEADEQRLLQSRNAVSPRLDAVALYRWNGLEGQLLGQSFASRPGQFTDWNLGVNFSVPLGLRAERARLRQQELIIARDEANLEQGYHSAVHLIALSFRNLARYYRQYEIAKETREAARFNLSQQIDNFRAGRTNYINVLLAINDWGNSIGSEAQFLSLYNMELINLEVETGTVLETHGVRFYEERYRSLGPLGGGKHQRAYPRDLRPTPNVDRYPPGSGKPSESNFRLIDPLEQGEPRQPELLPPAAPGTPTTPDGRR